MDKTLKEFHSCAPRHAAPEYGLRKNGKVFAMTCLNLQEAENMAEALRKDGAMVEVFETSHGRSSGPQKGQG
jgi:hypothetical protein